MASGNERVPNKAEVEKELERLLASKRLKAAPNQARMLRYVVRQRLQDTDVSEAIIGHALFPHWIEDGSDDVRVTARNLRNTLARYYAEEGAGNPVVITLPRGPKYRALFSFNSPAAKPYERGLHLYAALKHTIDAEKAIEQFNKAIALDPGYAPAFAAKAEVEFSRAFFWQWPFPKDAVALAEASANEALRLSPTLWKPYLVLGMVHCARCAWDKAESSFKAALRASSEDVQRHAWYAAYLMATGREQKALRLVAESARDAPGDPAAQSLHALLLYVTRQFDKAEAILHEVETPTHWFTHIVLACVLPCIRESDEAWIHARRANVLIGDGLPGFEALCMRDGKQETRPFREERNRHLLSNLKDYPGQHALQLALCHIALGEPQDAIAALRRARREHDPMMIWAHLWPLFDPLRKYAGFRQLIDQMGFPGRR
jgi:tetratricopeptide (TPR) repeat protein